MASFELDAALVPLEAFEIASCERLCTMCTLTQVTRAPNSQSRSFHSVHRNGGYSPGD